VTVRPVTARPFGDVAGRRVVVTGGGTGIGAATVRAFATAGAHVMTCGRDAAALETVAAEAQQSGVEVHTRVVDLADDASLDAFAADAADTLGGVDVLVNNAGETALRDFLSTDENDWQRSFQVNLFAAVRMTRAMLPGMIARSWGRIIMVSSSGAKYPTTAWVDYAAAKAALAATGKALAREYASSNVLVNTLLPGLIRTPMTERSMAVVGAHTGQDVDEVAAAWAADVPLHRWGEPVEVAALIRFLCSDDASYINGAAFDIDGGMASHVY
jgi:NAD(P)-dependent dehydrogenase (short-subunit alcohol dehydrogenase family)